MKILILGDIVGRPGRRAVRDLVPGLRQLHGIEFCLANGENAAGGRGITRAVFQELRESGVDAVTLGDHVWDQDDAFDLLASEPMLLRPDNGYPGQPGGGARIIPVRQGLTVGVINLMGRVFMPPLFDCPFQRVDSLLSEWRGGGPDIVLVDFHAEATSEKVAMGHYLDGRVSSVSGTHTHVQTADEQVLGNGTAYITDLGMTGPMDSVLGRQIDSVLRRFTTGLPGPLPMARHEVKLHGVVVDVDDVTGRARSIRRIQEPYLREGPG